MARRKITMGDWLKGAGQSIRSGNGMNPLTTQRFVNAAHDERLSRTAGSQPSHGHKGGFKDAEHGFIDGKPVTFALGWGNNAGHTLLADGHVNLSTFKTHGNHNHYGPGTGPNMNVRDRGKYSGPDA